ncbi:MAG TPA: c-type cytochrome domain-containing protein [Kofleriaceae bacterium]|nr:c-type cytochrome domain-containing protein [Kofleriaceae bacterium]
MILLIGGCVDSLAPDVGPIAHAPCTDDDSNPDRDVHFAADLHDGIFASETFHCVRCHTPSGATPIGYEVTGLDLSSYDTLTAGARGFAVVVPGAPCASVLVQKLGEAPPFGGRMPLDGPPFLTDDDLQLVADWIAEGAREN